MPYAKRKDDWVNTTDYIDESDVDAWEQATYELKTNMLDIRDFGASTSSLDNTAAVQAALDAADVTGTGIIWIPPGTWKFTGTLTINRGRATVIRGSGVVSTTLLWTEDLGEGEYAIKCASAFASLETVLIENLRLQGPASGTLVFGDPPAGVMMRGIEMAGGVTCTDVVAGNLWCPFVFTSNHCNLRYCRAVTSYYGAYWDPHPVQDTVGNHTLDTVTLQGTFAAIGTDANTSIAGSVFTQVHLIDSPYGFYRETGSLGTRVWVGGIAFIGCSFETLGHALMYDEDMDGQVIDNSWIGCGHAAQFATSHRIAGRDVDYWVRSGLWTRNFVSCSGSLFTAGDLGVFEGSVVDLEVRWDMPGLGAGVQPVAGTSTRMIVHTGAGRCVVVRCTAGCLEDDLLVFNGTGVTKSTTGAPAGVAQHAADANDTVLMAKDSAPSGSGGVPVNTADATIASNDYVKMDTVNAGKVVKATGPLDGTPVGLATTAYSSGQCNVRLRGL